MQRSRYFQVDWVLVDELAIGPAPRKQRHLDRLHELGIKGVLSLCAFSEAEPPETFDQSFQTRRIVLPDHRAGRMPSTKELETALENLRELLNHGPVFVHCVAAMARSPPRPTDLAGRSGMTASAHRSGRPETGTHLLRFPR